MKVLSIDISNVSIQSTGSAKVCKELVTELVNSFDLGSWNVIIVQNDPEIYKYMKDRLSKKVVFVSENFYSFNIKVDKIFFPVPNYSISKLLQTARSCDSLILQVLDLIAFKNRNYFPNIISWVVYVVVSYCFFFKASVIVVNSNTVRLAFCKIPLGKLLTRKIVEIPLGIKPIKEIKNFEKTSRSRVILVIGTSYEHKNRIWALKIMRKLFDEDIHYKVIFSGPDPKFGHTRLKDDLFIQRNLRSFANNLAFPGWVSDELLDFFIDNSDLVLYTSVEEGFGLVPFEILARNKLCLFGRVGIFENIEFDKSLIKFLTLDNLVSDYRLFTDFLINPDLYDNQRAEMLLLSKNYSISNYTYSISNLLQGY
jgi:glycosyltransferase involved in cell wall biosynthesis